MARQAQDLQERSRRVTAGTLLRSERATLRDLRSQVHAGIDHAVADVRREQHASGRRKAAVLALLLFASRSMATNAARAIRDGRRRARIAGAARLRLELGLAGLAVGGGLLLAHEHRPEDAHHAQTSGESLATQWLSLATVAVGRALRRDEDVTSAIDETRRAMEHRAARTAGTETAQAFNDERSVGLADAIERDAEFAAAIEAAGFVRYWDAILDRRTCQVCRNHDGETAPIGASFSDDDEPGDVHVLCRCIAMIVPASWGAKAAA